MNVKTILLSGLGLFFLGLAAIGLVLPVLPTTPFVLLSAACFTSNPRLRTRVMKIKFFKEYIENYEQRNGLSRKTVAKSLIWLWGMLLLSMLLMKILWISLLLSAIGTAVTAHILWISKPRSTKDETKE